MTPKANGAKAPAGELGAALAAAEERVKETAAGAEGEAKRGPGRPKGSGAGASHKKKVKVKASVPPQVSMAIALAPLGILSMITAKALKMEPPRPSPQACDDTHEAFKAWLASLDADLTPGWALLACYGTAALEMTAIVAMTMEERARERAERAKATPTTMAPAPGVQVPTTPEPPPSSPAN